MRSPTAVYYSRPTHLQIAYVRFGHGLDSQPVSERLNEGILALPMNPFMDDAGAEQVSAAIQQAVWAA